MATRILSECLACHSPISYFPYHPKKFCGSACYHDAQRRGLVKVGHDLLPKNARTCTRCGNAGHGCLSKDRKGQPAKHWFCSRDCYDLFRAERIERLKVPCTRCGKLVYRPQKKHKQKFCTDACRRAHTREQPRNCIQCGCFFTAVKFRFGHWLPVKMKTCSIGCHRDIYRTSEARKLKISEAFRGDRHPNWQGGSHGDGFRGAGWQRLSEAVRKRANYQCEHCGMHQDEHIRLYKQRLNVNHKEPFHQHSNKTKCNRMSNLEALCKRCHMKADWKYRKENPMQMAMAWR